MKVGGKTIELPKPEICVIPRDDGDIIFLAAPVFSGEEFEKLCPQPEPPIITYPDGRTKSDVNNPGYAKNLTKWAKRRAAWNIIQSLKATEGLEWEIVNEDDPETWERYLEELRLHFTEGEIAEIITAVNNANSIDEDKQREARELFIKSQAEV